MRNTHGLLIRFIDCGLLLLMAFLAIADLTPQVQVALPHGTAQTDEVGEVLRIRFDSAMMAVRREGAGQDLCQEWSLPSLAACLRTLSQQPARWLLSPIGDATVQRMVSVMDVCRQEGLSCAVASLP